VLSASPSDSPKQALEKGLDEWPLHRDAWVERLVHSLNQEQEELLLRLLEIGFVPGECVRVIARGFPGAEPIAVRVGHTTFALRRFEAALIRVVATPPEKVQP
jgi:ferrous iron transport protein A